MITKTQITDIIHRHSYNVEDQAGNHLIVVDDDDWDEIAEEIVKILPISDVVVPKGTLCRCECEMPDIDGRQGLCGRCERPIIA